VNARQYNCYLDAMHIAHNGSPTMRAWWALACIKARFLAKLDRLPAWTGDA